ncbi:pilin [Polymorphospora rubra]|uniref:pilin n=1 Tax=Polymorphospora rubra TaxID=338584 RepID=UPI0033C370A3
MRRHGLVGFRLYASGDAHPFTRAPAVGRRWESSMYRKLLRVAVAGVVALVWVVLAAAPASAVDPMLAVADLPTVIRNLTGWIVGIIAAVATLFLTIGGARYLMAGGDPSEVERAKDALKSAGVGYALAVLAPVILAVLKGVLGVP